MEDLLYLIPIFDLETFVEKRFIQRRFHFNDGQATLLEDPSVANERRNVGRQNVDQRLFRLNRRRQLFDDEKVFHRIRRWSVWIWKTGRKTQGQSFGGTLAEHSTYNPMVRGSYPALAPELNDKISIPKLHESLNIHFKPLLKPKNSFNKPCFESA